MQKIINSKMAKYQPTQTENMVLDDEPTEGSFNGITSDAVAKVAGDVGDVKDVIPEGTSEENPLVNAASLKILEEEILSIDTPKANTLRFEFSKMDYDPTVAGVGSSGTWKKLNAKFNNVWDWTKSGTSFANAFDDAFKDGDNMVSILAAGDTSAVTNMSSMFRNCSSLTSIPLFDTSAVTNMNAMFVNCSSLKSIPLFNTSSVTSMRNMFFGCANLTSVPLLNISAVTDMYAAFYGCSSLTNLPLFDTSSVTTMNSTFVNCSSLKSIPLLDTSNVTDMLNMLRNCSSLTNLPLFDTSKATNMNTTFYGCTKVESGAQALYQQASTQTTPPSSHTDCFKDCGKDTETGAAELEQIPASWGGTSPATLNMGAPQNIAEPLSPSVIDGDSSLTK